MDNRRKTINENNIENINYEKGKPNRFNTATKIISIILSIIAIIISVFSLDTNKKAYNLNSEENLSISVTTDIINFFYNDNVLMYKTKMTICFINYSNLPIYITDLNINKIRTEKDGFKTVTIDSPVNTNEINYPINIKPQETMFTDYYINSAVPIGTSILLDESFDDILNENPVNICNFLFFENHLDLLGNQISTKEIDGVVYYDYNYTPTIMMEIICKTAKGHSFSTKFKDGLYIDTETDDYKFEFFRTKSYLSEYIYEYISKDIFIIIIIIQFFIIILILLSFLIIKIRNKTRKIRRRRRTRPKRFFFNINEPN